MLCLRMKQLFKQKNTLMKEWGWVTGLLPSIQQRWATCGHGLHVPPKTIWWLSPPTNHTTEFQRQTTNLPWKQMSPVLVIFLGLPVKFANIILAVMMGDKSYWLVIVVPKGASVGPKTFWSCPLLEYSEQKTSFNSCFMRVHFRRAMFAFYIPTPTRHTTQRYAS